MSGKKNYKCTFKQMGGRSGEVDYKLEAFFSLTEEEYKQAVDALNESEGHMSDDFPEDMYSAITKVSMDTFRFDSEEYGEFEMDDIDDYSVSVCVFRISYPEEVK